MAERGVPPAAEASSSATGTPQPGIDPATTPTSSSGSPEPGEEMANEPVEGPDISYEWYELDEELYPKLWERVDMPSGEVGVQFSLQGE